VRWKSNEVAVDKVALFLGVNKLPEDYMKKIINTKFDLKVILDLAQRFKVPRENMFNFYNKPEGTTTRKWHLYKYCISKINEIEWGNRIFVEGVKNTENHPKYNLLIKMIEEQNFYILKNEATMSKISAIKLLFLGIVERVQGKAYVSFKEEIPNCNPYVRPIVLEKDRFKEKLNKMLLEKVIKEEEKNLNILNIALLDNEKSVESLTNSIPKKLRSNESKSEESKERGEKNKGNLKDELIQTLKSLEEELTILKKEPVMIEYLEHGEFRIVSKRSEIPYGARNIKYIYDDKSIKKLENRISGMNKKILHFKEPEHTGKVNKEDDIKILNVYNIKKEIEKKRNHSDTIKRDITSLSDRYGRYLKELEKIKNDNKIGFTKEDKNVLVPHFWINCGRVVNTVYQMRELKIPRYKEERKNDNYFKALEALEKDLEELEENKPAGYNNKKSYALSLKKALKEINEMSLEEISFIVNNQIKMDYLNLKPKDVPFCFHFNKIKKRYKNPLNMNKMVNFVYEFPKHTEEYFLKTLRENKISKKDIREKYKYDSHYKIEWDDEGYLDDNIFGFDQSGYDS
jgi:hypothetical protein